MIILSSWLYFFQLYITNILFVCLFVCFQVDGHLYVWGRSFHGAPDVYRPHRVTADLVFSQVALGWNHALVLTGMSGFRSYYDQCENT